MTCLLSNVWDDSSLSCLKSPQYCFAGDHLTILLSQIIMQKYFGSLPLLLKRTFWLVIFSILVTTNQKKKQLQNTDSFNPSLVYFSACAKQVGSLCRVTVDCGEASNISLDYAGSFSPQTDWLCFVRTIVHRVLCSQCSLSVFCKLSLNNTITWQLAAQSHYLHLKHSIAFKCMFIWSKNLWIFRIYVQLLTNIWTKQM